LERLNPGIVATARFGFKPIACSAFRLEK